MSINIRILGYLFLAIISLCSCVDQKEKDFNNTILKESLFLNLNIKTSSESATRADAEGYNDDELEEGSFTENYIDIENNDFHIVLFNSSGDFITDIWADEIDNKTENNNDASHLLEILLKNDKLIDFPKDFQTEEFTVLVLANWKSFTGNGEYVSFAGKNIKDGLTDNIWTDNDLYNFEYPLDSEETWYPSIRENSRRLIPMMGMGKFTGFSISPVTGFPVANVTVIMLRSLAKITLSLNDGLWKNGFEISHCQLNKIASKGKILPDMSHEDNTFERDGNIHIGYPWDTREIEEIGPVSFIKIQEEGKKPILTAYVPEMLTSEYNTSSEGRPYLTANLKLNNENFFEEDKIIELNENQNSSTKLFHILRNHHYNFVIERISDKGKIVLSYTVCPWDESNVNIGFH